MKMIKKVLKAIGQFFTICYDRIGDMSGEKNKLFMRECWRTG